MIQRKVIKLVVKDFVQHVNMSVGVVEEKYCIILLMNGFYFMTLYNIHSCIVYND